MSTYQGQCHCGAVQWCVPRDEVDFTSICHCSECQNSSGSSFGNSSLMIYTPSAIEFKGKDAIKARETKSERGKSTQRGFCSACGTPLFDHVSEGQPDGYYAMRTGTMREAAGSLKIDKEIFMKSKLPWVPAVTGSSSQQFDAMPH